MINMLVIARSHGTLLFFRPVGAAKRGAKKESSRIGIGSIYHSFISFPTNGNAEEPLLKKATAVFFNGPSAVPPS